MDGIELVMEVEDHFGISIRDEEAPQVLRTVGDLAAIVHQRIETAHQMLCPTLSAFLKLRAIVREVVHIDRLRIRPTMRIIDTLTPRQRLRLWTHLRGPMSLRATDLRRPRWLRRLLVAMIVVVIPLAIAFAAWVDLGYFPLALIAWPIGAFALLMFTARFATTPPENLSTFGALSKNMAGATVATKHLHLRTIDSIVDELRPIVAHVLNIAPSKVVPSARFIEDLGMA